MVEQANIVDEKSKKAAAKLSFSSICWIKSDSGWHLHHGWPDDTIPESCTVPTHNQIKWEERNHVPVSLMSYRKQITFVFLTDKAEHAA